MIRLAPISKRAIAGTSLLEMLAYVAVLAVLINVCLMAFVMTSRLSTRGTQVAERMAGVEEIRACFTESVRAALGVCPRAGEYASGADCLVLEASPREDRPFLRYIVWRRLAATGQLMCLELSERDGAVALETTRALGVPLDALEFRYDGAGDLGAAHRVTMAFSLKSGQATAPGARAPSAATHEFVASFRITPQPNTEAGAS